MAKESMKNRELKYQLTVTKYAKGRAKLKAIIANLNSSAEERWSVQVTLREQPRDANASRLCSRCHLTDRPHGFCRRFGLNRSRLREIATHGNVPDLAKTNWQSQRIVPLVGTVGRDTKSGPSWGLIRFSIISRISGSPELGFASPGAYGRIEVRDLFLCIRSVKPMSMQGLLADMLTRIRNAQMAEETVISIPSPELKAAVAKILKDKGYTADLRISSEARFQPSTELKYFEGRPIVKEIKHISYPSLCQYRSVEQLPKVRGGLGVSIVSTNKGVMTDHTARTAGVSGETPCIMFQGG